MKEVNDLFLISKNDCKTYIFNNLYDMFLQGIGKDDIYEALVINFEFYYKLFE